MPKFLQTAREKARVILDRERPFFTPGAMSMYALALIAEAPVIIARYLLALLIVTAAPNGRSSPFSQPRGRRSRCSTQPVARGGGKHAQEDANHPNASNSPTKTPSSYSKQTPRHRCHCRRTGS
jgi:hypothetical protein